MEWQLWTGRLCWQNNGMTTLDGKPMLPRLWNDNSGWDATVTKSVENDNFGWDATVTKIVE
eukprot:4810238-Amphidinium_carterae.1